MYKDKEKERKNKKKYYKKYKKKLLTQHKKYRNEHKREQRKWHKEWREEHIEEIRKHIQNRLHKWSSLFSDITSCKSCGRPISFNSCNQRTSINFDHRHGGKEAIKGLPASWLRGHNRTPKNEVIWKSCDFGALCFRCNHFLPRKDRKKWLKKITKYIKQDKEKKGGK